MKNIELSVPDGKFDFFISLLKNLDFVKIRSIQASTNAKKREFLDDLEHAVAQVKLAKEGKIKLQSAEDLLDEL
jgi:hypothetical protein